MAITAVTFVTFMGSGPGRNRGGSEPDSYGKIYGHEISRAEYVGARNEFYLFYWFRNFQWPNNLKNGDADEQIYLRLLLTRKAESLGIHVSDEAAGTAARTLLHSLDRNGRQVTPEAFETQVLKPANLTLEDFEGFARSDLVIQQLIQAIGLTGELLTPQQAADIYQRDHQELAAQAVFFSASNYLSQVTVAPEIVSQFYTNYMAEYRLPDRVQVSYVVFELSNYLAGAEQKIGTTNLNEQVDAIFRKYGMQAAPMAKTPEEAKAKIHEDVIHQHALDDAKEQANAFATEVFGKAPARGENLAAVAKQKGLVAHTTAPFSSAYGPQEFPASEDFIKAAFGLTPDEPFAGPLSAPAGVYVIALDKQLPSEIPALDQIRERVASDYQMMQASALAQRAGTNFVRQLAMQMAAGKSFGSACDALGMRPRMLPPFSASTDEMPGLSDRVNLPQLKQAAFTTPVGRISNFEATGDGGFIVYVEKKLPMDRSVMNSQLPQFAAQIRRERANEIFNNWLQGEAGRELHDTPVFQKQVAPQNKS